MLCKDARPYAVFADLSDLHETKLIFLLFAIIYNCYLRQ